MKWLPTVLVLVAFLVLLKISSLRPSAVEESPSQTSAAEASSPPVPESARGGSADSPDPTEDAANPGTSTGGNTTGEATDPEEAVAAAPAKTTPTPPPPVQTEPGMIHGTVVNAKNRSAPNVRVLLRDLSSAGERTAVTDAFGRFEFRNASAGTYELHCEDPDALYTVSSFETVRLGASDVLETEIRVDRGRGSIQGTVLDHEGDPLARVNVQARSGRWQPEPVMTNNKGHYRIGGLPDGDWQVVLPQFQASPFASRARRTCRIVNGNLVDAAKEPLDQAPAFVIPQLASLTLTVGDSVLFSYEFTGDEAVRLEPTDETLEAAVRGSHPDPDKDWSKEELRTAKEAERERLESVLTAHPDEDGTVKLNDVWPGSYVVRALTAGGDSLLDDDLNPKSDKPPITLTVLAGAEMKLSVPIYKAERGSGIHIPVWFKVGLFILFPLLAILPLLFFPVPLIPKRPPAVVQAEREAAAQAAESSAQPAADA